MTDVFPERSDGTVCVQEEYRKAAEKALKLLLVQDRTRSGLAGRLRRAGFSGGASEYAVRYAEECGYIDDLRYAGNYLSCHKHDKSRKEIWHKLDERGIPREILEKAFLEYAPDDEEVSLRNQLQKKLSGKSPDELGDAEKNKLLGYFARRGYACSSIRRVLAGSDVFPLTERKTGL